MNIRDSVWIGLLQTCSISDKSVLGNAKNAYVNVLGIADNEDDFKNKIKNKLPSMGLCFISIEDVEIFSERSTNFEINDNVINLAIEVYETKDFRFGNFHTF